MLRLLHVFTLCLTGMTAEQPGIGHTELCLVNAMAIVQTEPLEPTDEREVADVLSNEEQESSFRINAVGDHGRSTGPMQILNGAKLSTLENVKAGIEQMRISFAICKEHRFAPYVGGPRGCDDPKLQRMSSGREHLAARILSEITSHGTEVAKR